MPLLPRVKEMKDVNFVLEKQKEKTIWILVMFEKKKKEKRQSPSSTLALIIPRAMPGCYGVQLSPFKM